MTMIDTFSYLLGVATPFALLGVGVLLAALGIAWKNTRKSKTDRSLSLLHK